MESLLRTVDRFVTRRTFRVAQQITADEKLSAQLAGDAAMTDDERDTISSLTETVVQQYGLTGEHTPLAMLCVTVAGYTARSFYVLHQLEDIAKKNAAANTKPLTPTLSPTDGAREENKK